MSFFIADWQVLPDVNRLRRGGELVEVEPRVMAVLEELAREPGRVVTRDDLHRTVWQDVIVTDDALNRCIRELRRLLGDDARSPAFIETISKRGYRLIAPVTRHEPEEPKSSVQLTSIRTTLLGHHALVMPPREPATIHHESVRLRSDGTSIRTRTFAALTPFVYAIGAFVISALLIYGRPWNFGHGLGLALLVTAIGAFAGMPARRRALDRSRAAIAAFLKAG